jgi:Ca2+-binding RTX toxin-like protein
VLGAGVTSFNAGNIILGGGGSDLLEGRGDDDIIDGDRWLNVRISVRQNKDGTGPEIRSVKSMTELVPDMLAGTINPGQLQIVREILTATAPATSTRPCSRATCAEYTITTAADGATVVAHVTPLDAQPQRRHRHAAQHRAAAVQRPGGGADARAERRPVRPADARRHHAAGEPGADRSSASRRRTTSPTPNPDGITGAGRLLLAGRERRRLGRLPGHRHAGRRRPRVGHGLHLHGDRGLGRPRLRVRAVYQDAHGVLENVFSAATQAVRSPVPAAGAAAPPVETDVTTPGVHLIRSDLQFILDQIMIGEANSGAYGTPKRRTCAR